MQKWIVTAAAIAVAAVTAGCASNADRRQAQYAEAGGNMEYSIAVVQSEQNRLLAEQARRDEAARKAAAQKAAAKAKADKARAEANAKAAAEKKARQAKLDSYYDRERELKLQMQELDVKARAAQVDGIVATERAKAERARDKADLELEQIRAQIRQMEAQQK